MIDINTLDEGERGELIKNLFAQELQALAVATDQERIGQLEDSIAVLSAVLHRRNLAAVIGKSFGMDRDLFEALGYPKELTAEMLAAKYHRNEIAGRIVDLPANATWKNPPMITDGSTGNKSAFIEGLEWLQKTRQLWATLNDFDRKLGIGYFGILVVGIENSGKLETPLSKAKRGYKSVAYLRPFPHDAISRIEYDEDENSPRFGLPVFFTVNMGMIGDKSIGDRRVHYSRVIYAGENAVGDQVMGRSRLERPYNRLEDLDRVIGASSESAWRLAIKGTVIEGKEGYKALDPIADELKAKNEAFINGLERTMVLSGATYQQLGGEMVDPSGLFSALGVLLAAGADIPKRILFGTEEAQLAGSQDQQNWAAQIKSRRENFVNPSIIRRFIDYLINNNLLDKPAGGDYGIGWRSNFEQTEEQAAAARLGDAQALLTAANARIAGANISDQELRAFGGLPPEPDQAGVMGLAANNDKLKAAIRWLFAAVLKRPAAHAGANGSGPDRVMALEAPISFPTDGRQPTDAEIEQAIRDWDQDFPELEGLIEAILNGDNGG